MTSNRDIKVHAIREYWLCTAHGSGFHKEGGIDHNLEYIGQY